MGVCGGCGKPSELSDKDMVDIINMLKKKTARGIIVKKYKIGYERLYKIMENNGIEVIRKCERATETKKADEGMRLSSVLSMYLSTFRVGSNILVLIKGEIKSGTVTAKNDYRIIVKIKNKHIIITINDIADKTVKIKHHQSDKKALLTHDNVNLE